MIFNSIRWRLQVWHGLILVLVLAGFGFMAYHVAHENQARRTDWDLGQRLFDVERRVGRAFRPEPPDPSRERHGERRRFGAQDFQLKPRDPAQLREAIEKTGLLDAGQTNGFYLVLWGADGTVLARSAGAPENVPLPEQFKPGGLDAGPGPGTPGPGFGPRRGPGDAGPEAGPGAGPPRRSFGPGPGPPPFYYRTRGEWRELSRAMPWPGGEWLLVGRSLAPDLAAMRRLALGLAAAGTAVLLFGLAGGWWLATRAIRPIEDIGRTAMKIAAGDLSQRINAADAESELGRLAGVLNSTFARLEAAFAHQARFTADASHELRTPVSVILSQTQTALSRERPAPEYREALEACQRAARRMRKLTESLLELARLDAGQEPMKCDRLDLARVARECVELVRPLAAEVGVEIRCDLPQVECVGDAERLGQVATNLLSNALIYNHSGGEVRVSTAAHNGSALLTVADTGQGIPTEDLPHIFERFYRVDKARSNIQGRTGLGLAICKAIVDAHSGTIEVSTQLGAGSAFSVKLPAK